MQTYIRFLESKAHPPLGSTPSQLSGECAEPLGHFFSCCIDIPLLENLGALNLSGIHWVIVGGESGSNARPMKYEWVDSIRIQCEEQGVSFFFKQWGSWGADGKKRAKSANGRLLNDRTWDQLPISA